MKKIIFIAGLILPTVLFGQLDRSVRPNPGQARTINIKDSEVFTTSNGITVILSENHKLPRVSIIYSQGLTQELKVQKLDFLKWLVQ